MPTNKLFLAPLEPDRNYHICNRTNNGALLFRSDENRRYFLSQSEAFLSHLLDLYGWCLLPNHFHYQVKMKSEEYVKEQLLRIPKRRRTITQNGYLIGEKDFDQLATRAFTNLFISYSLATANQQRRKGNLFYREFKRTLIEDDQQFRNTMIYVHTNPVKHGIVDDFSTYQWSSWDEFANRKFSKIPREEVYEIFGNKQGFISSHFAHQDYLLEKRLYDL